MAYGITNQCGKTPASEVAEILEYAQSVGISLLDTASLYGEAEIVLGANSLHSFRVVTKTPRFNSGTIDDAQVEELLITFSRSLRNLGLSQVEGLLAHHAQDLLVSGGDRLIESMQSLKEEGTVNRIGVSIYDGTQIDELLKKFTPDIIQLPLNILDQRLIQSGQLQRLKEHGIEIHARSVFLQGLLLMPLEQLPAYFEPVRPLLARCHSMAQEQGMTITQAALSFVRDILEVDIVLVGVESKAQLCDCIENFTVAEKFYASGLACNDPRFVNPSLWRK